MKKLTVLFILLLAFAGNSFAQTALPAIFTFNGNNPAGTVEYFVEKQVGANWVEIVKGPQSPINTTLLPGMYVFRVKARWIGVAATSGAGVSLPSEELSSPWGAPTSPTLLKLAALMLPNGKILAVIIR